MDNHPQHTKLAKELSEQFYNHSGVISVALGGSSTGSTGDYESDIDLYIFTNTPVPLETRRGIAQKFNATRINLDLQFWDPGDEWFDGETGIEVDIMYWDPKWIEDQIVLRLNQHKPSLGYSTCTWHTIKHARVLKDRDGWLSALIGVCNQPYPESLRQAIIHHNYPVLRDVVPAYLHQIEKAVRRQDLVSINHRIAAFLASYFDIIYAFNRVTHPGEKKLLQITPELCSKIPNGMIEQVECILQSSSKPDNVLIKNINDLIDGLDNFFIIENYTPYS